PSARPSLPTRRSSDLDQVHAVLDHLVLATQLRFPVIGDLARSVRFRWFDQPLVDEARSEVLAGVRDDLADLAEHPDAPDYAERVDRKSTRLNSSHVKN